MDRGLVVYVVDDDAGVREALARLMGSAGFQAIPFANVDDLIAGADSARHGCVLLDLSVERSTGGQRIGQRLAERGLAMPVIALTGDEREGASREAHRAGARFMLRKPVDGRALLDAIEWVTTHERDWK